MKRLALTIIALLGISVLCGETLAQTSFPWPVTPFNSSQLITGSFCEYRDTGNPEHFHNGTDIPKADGSPVYPVKNGTVVSLSDVGSSAYVRVDDIAYVHIMPNPALTVGSSVTAQQTVLGTILPGQGHVHFTNGYVGSERNSLLPGSGLTPYVDDWKPTIRYIHFYQNNTTVPFNNNTVSGLVDIVVKVDEANGPPGSPTSVLNNGIYEIGYKILSADTQTEVYLPPADGWRYRFNTKPSNGVVNTVFFGPLSSTTSHVYQVTNTVFGDDFWNAAALPDSDYVVMVWAGDTHGNRDTLYQAVTTTEADLVPPEAPRLKYVRETPTGMEVAWYPNSDPDLTGYRLYFSFDNRVWNLFGDENELKASASDTTINQILRRDVYFRLSAVDDAPLPNESAFSDVYAMSNGSFRYPEKVLIVDDFERTSGAWNLPSHDLAVGYGQDILATGFSYDVAANDAVVDSLVLLADYDAVIWFTGDEGPDGVTIDSLEQDLIETYLQGGGNLCISGTRIAWDLDPEGNIYATPSDEAFLHDFLKVDFATLVESPAAVAYTPDSFFMWEFTITDLPYAPDSLNGVTPWNGGHEDALFLNDSSAAVSYSGQFGGSNLTAKMIFLGFPLELVDDAGGGQYTMEGVLNYFFLFTGIEYDPTANSGLPREFSLSRNFPNPFNPSTSVRFALPLPSEVNLTIFNALGQRVKTLMNERRAAGSYTVQWDGHNEAGLAVPSGVYFLKMTAREGSGFTFEQMQKLLLIK